MGPHSVRIPKILILKVQEVFLSDIVHLSYISKMGTNGGKTKKDTNVRMHTKSKRMELENPGCSGFKDF